MRHCGILCVHCALRRFFFEVDGPNAFDDFQASVRQDDDEVQQSFWDEVMCEDDENLIDLAAPLMFNAGIRFSDLSKENQEWARLFPNFLLPFPEHSHPDIPQFDAHVLMDKVASYSSSLQQKKFCKPIRSSDKARDKYGQGQDADDERYYWREAYPRRSGQKQSSRQR
jgi:hypothetical protein